MRNKIFGLSILMLGTGMITSCSSSNNDAEEDRLIDLLLLNEDNKTREFYEESDIELHASVKIVYTVEDSINILLGQCVEWSTKAYQQAVAEVEANRKMMADELAELGDRPMGEYVQNEINKFKMNIARNAEIMNNFAKEFDGTANHSNDDHKHFEDIYRLRKLDKNTVVAKIVEFRKTKVGSNGKMAFEEITLRSFNPELTEISEFGVTSGDLKPVKMDLELIHFKPYVEGN